MKSRWVHTEIAEARAKERREGRRVLFPIALIPFEAIGDWKLFDADLGSDSAREVREYFIPDFSAWTDSAAFEGTLTRLLEDLRHA
jgi:hypothetical protein